MPRPGRLAWAPWGSNQPAVQTSAQVSEAENVVELRPAAPAVPAEVVVEERPLAPVVDMFGTAAV